MRYEIRKVDLLQIVKSYFSSHGDIHTLQSISFFTGIMGIFLALMFAFAFAMIGTLTMGLLIWIFNQAAGSSGGLILDLERHIPDRLADVELERKKVPTVEEEEPVA